MADGKKQDETRSRNKKFQRDYYLRNRHWLLEEARERRRQAREEREQASKPRKGRPRLYDPSMTRKERREAAQARREAAQEALARKLEQDEWDDIGWVVAKMNKVAKMSQVRIYEILGGLATKQKIAEWCAKAKNLDRIEPSDRAP